MKPKELVAANILIEQGIVDTLDDADKLDALVYEDWQKLKEAKLAELKGITDNAKAFELFAIAWLRGYTQHVNKSRTPRDTTYIG